MSSPLSDLLEVRKGLMQSALQKLNITKKEIAEVIVSINKWFKQQPQMPNITPDPEYIEKLYIRSKGDLELTKLCIDLYYSLRSTNPDIFSNWDPLLPELQNSFKAIPFAFMPNLTEDGFRIEIYRFQGDYDFDVNFYYKRMMMLYALRAHYDFPNGNMVIFDFKHFSLEQKKNLTKDVTLTIGLSAKFAYLSNYRFHFVNINPLANVFLHDVKTVLSLSLYRNAWIHPNTESLHKLVDKKFLPKELGGSQKSISEIQNQWWIKAKEYRNWFLMQDQYRTDESKRVGKLPLEKLANILPIKMISRNIQNLIELKPELKLETLKKLNLSQEDIDNALSHIKKWFADQSHLPDIIPDPDYVERLFVIHRGDIQRIKRDVDMYYTLKTLSPEIFSNRDSLLPELKRANDHITIAFTYPLTPKGERIFCYNFLKHSGLFEVNNFLKVMYMEFDLRMRYDYASDIIIVADIKNIEPEDMEKLNSEKMLQVMIIMQEAYNFYIKEMHFVHAPSNAEKFMLGVKEAMRPDLPSQVFYWDNVDQLHQFVPKSVLPSDFGGDQPSVVEMHKKWYDEMIEMREFFLEEDKHIVDEVKRVDKSMLDNIYKFPYKNEGEIISTKQTFN